MPSSYFSLKNLATSATTPHDASTWPPSVSSQIQFASKQEFRDWCLNPQTDWLFYILIEGLNPSARPNLLENPPHILHGFVADYDGDGIELPKLVDRCQKLVDRVRPTWVSETYSHKARVIWEFDTPIQLSGDQKTDEKLMKAIAKELQVEKLAPGLDPASFTTTTFWEVGRNWWPIGGKTKRDTLLAVWLNLVDKLKFKASDNGESIIPLDVVKEGLEKQFPEFSSRWSGSFEVGQRGPLFWINDGIDRVGCVVTDGGMRSFSTRAAKGFMSWQDLLGHEFVKAYHQKRLGEAAGDAYFEIGSGSYCLQNPKGWSFWGKDDMTMRLKVAGISHRMKPGTTCTEAEQVLVMIQENRPVDSSAPFMFNTNPVVSFNSRTFLNTAFSSRVLKPTGEADLDNCPWLFEFFNNVFDDQEFNGCRPLDYFLAWLQRFWRGGLTGKPVLGQMVVLSGKTSRGKSFMGTTMLRKIMGGAVDAANYLLEGRGFNKELGAAPVWNVDDAKSTANFNDHKRFSEMLKKHVATPDLSFQPKFVDAVTIPWYGRIFITCNDDSDSLSILPTLDISILDKIMLFKCHSEWSANFGTLAENDAMLDRELPHFLAWLDQWEPPQGVIDHKNKRYGIHSYHHPLLVEAARDSSPDHRFVEILEAWREGMLTNLDAQADPIWSGTCTDLIRSINQDQSLGTIMRSYTPVAIGRIMSKVSQYWKPFIRASRSQGITHYYIDLRVSHRGPKDKEKAASS